jgi:hypothetical protein
MAFWAIFSVGFGACLVFFIWSVRNYVSATARRLKPRPGHANDMNPTLIALEAQHLLAPNLALYEARELADRLTPRHRRNRRAVKDFEALMARLREQDLARVRA